MERSLKFGWAAFGVMLGAIALGCATTMSVGEVIVRNQSRRDANIALTLNGKVKGRVEVTLPPGGEVVQRGWEAYQGASISLTAWSDGLWAPRNSASVEALGSDRIRDRNGAAVPLLFLLLDDENQLRIERRIEVEMKEGDRP